MSTRIVLATDDPGFEHRLRVSYPGGLNGDLRTLSHEYLGSTPAQAVAAIAGSPSGAPQVVALGPGMPIDAALDLARQLDLEHPEISIVLVAKPTPRLGA